MLDVGTEYGQQKFIDMLILALNDPEIMGKDVFGKERIVKVIEGILEYEDAFADAYTMKDESDYLQEKLDQRLRYILGEENFAPFAERYPYLKQWKY